MNRKEFSIVVIAFCLMAAMFSAISTSGLPYDPWTDINDDGKIDMRDISNAASQFGTFGDPTKNVNVTNWPSIPQPKTIIVADSINLIFPPVDTNTFFGSADVTGYRYVSLFCNYYTDGTRELRIWPSCGGISFFDTYVPVTSLGTGSSVGLNAYEVGAPNVDFSVYSRGATGGGTIYFTLILYCYN